MIIAYCLQEDINLNKEIDYLNYLFKQHGLSWLHYKPPEVTKIISLRKNCLSIFLFTFRKEQPESSFLKIIDFLESISVRSD